jgi:hypothetical protein
VRIAEWFPRHPVLSDLNMETVISEDCRVVSPSPVTSALSMCVKVRADIWTRSRRKRSYCADLPKVGNAFDVTNKHEISRGASLPRFRSKRSEQ